MSTRVRVGVFMTAFMLASCAQKQAPTPQNVSARYHAMLDTLDVNQPGAALLTLETFMNDNPSYTVADSVEQEILVWRAAIQGRYHQARELARDGEFDRAERMLKDLALLPQTEDGSSAVQHLDFEFYFEKAKSLMIRQRFEESEAVARELLTRDLSRFQRDQVEQILDHTANVGVAEGMVGKSRTEGACRQLIVLMANLYVNEGQYPASMSLGDLERLDPYYWRSIANELSAIEDYHATQDTYSLVAVGKRGERFRIVNGTLEN
jgi:hypothetical protein